MIELAFYLILISSDNSMCLYNAKTVDTETATEMLYRIKRRDGSCPSSIYVTVRETERAKWVR